MAGRTEGTVRPARPKKLLVEDVYWVWWLNLRSLDLLERDRSKAPYLRLVDEGKRLRLGLEAVRTEGPRIWTSPGAAEGWGELESRLAAAGDAAAGFESGLGPERAMSLQLRWALDKALEEYALAEVPCLQDAKKIAVLSLIAGWDGQSFERAALYTLGIDDDAGDTARAVDVSGKGLGLYLQEVPLWNVFQRLTCTAALLERDDWKPWDGDERLFNLKWTRGPRGFWRRWASVA